MNKNIIANISQNIISGIIVFLTYQYIIKKIGVSELGIWSFLIATISITRMADLGFTTSVTRYVAKYSVLDKNKISLVIGTSIIVTTVTTILICALSYPAINFIIKFIFEDIYEQKKALSLLPYLLALTPLSIIASIFLSSLDGFEKMAIRAFIMISSQVILLISIILIVPNHGLLGVVYAQVIQALFSLAAGYFSFKKELTKSTTSSIRWNLKIFKEILQYSIHVQISSIISLLFDPVTKACMIYYGGSGAAGYYEIANQIILRVRSVISSANQTIIPRVAKLDNSINFIYINNMKIIALVTIPIFAILFLNSQAISILFFKETNYDFTITFQLLCLAWFINVFAIPSYFYNLGDGNPELNTNTQIVMGVLNLILGIVLGYHLGGFGVLLGSSLSVAIASIYLIVVFNKKHEVSTSNIINRSNLLLSITSFLLCFLSYFSIKNLTDSMLYAAAASTIILCLTIFNSDTHNYWKAITNNHQH